MLSVQLVAQKRLEPRHVPDPHDPGPGEVLVRLRSVGICGSDLHWFLEGGVGHTQATYPIILGHEPAGEIVAAGRGVTGMRAGQKIAIEPSLTCGECEYCLGGQPNNCVSCLFMGGQQAPGFFREYAVIPARNVELLPNDMSFSSAALVEPTAVVCHVMELTTIRPGDTVAVIGAGPIGLLTASMAHMAGASQVFIADCVPHRLRLARQMGPFTGIATPRGDSAFATLRDAILDHTRGRGVDVTFDAAGQPDTILAGFHITRPSGQYVLIGIPSERLFHVDIHTAMHKELRIQTIKRSNGKGHEAIDLIRTGRISDVFITHQFKLAQTPEAFELVTNYRDGVGKVLIEMP